MEFEDKSVVPDRVEGLFYVEQYDSREFLLQFIVLNVLDDPGAGE